MTIRRAAVVSALLLAVTACTPSIPKEAPPASVVTAVFDPVAGDIPLPSDLVLQDPASLVTLPAAQRELLTVFKTQGGFPNDQEVAVTISFARDQINGDGSTTRVAPTMDPASFTPSTFFVFGVTSGGAVQGEIPIDPITAANFTTGPAAGGQGTVTTLTLHHKGRTPWAPGRYAVLVRGGPSGVKTTAGDPVYASPVFFLVAQGQDMTRADNLALLKAQTGSTSAALALAAQLNGLIAAYGPAFAAGDTRFPHQELASAVGFSVAPAQTQVDLDPGRGLVPLPIDLLRDPRPASGTCAACGKLTPLAACTLAAGTLNPTTGACSSPAAAGFAALDGFSTTAPILAPTNDLISAATVTPTTYRIFELPATGAPVEVPAASYIHEPVEFTSSGFSPVVAAQPAGATAGDATSVFRTRPLKDDTNYAVVITTGVKDKTGAPLKKGTVASVLLFDNPLVDGTGKSQLLGIDDLTAGALDVMRLRLLPVRAALAAQATPVLKADIAMAYTFKTQSILGVATRLGALPYLAAAAAPNLALPGPISVSTPAAAFNAYGVAPVIPSSNIDEVIETDIATINLLDPLTGAFDPNKRELEPIHVIITTPKVTNANVPACTGGMAPFGKCAPLMVFRHGLGGGRQQMLLAADTFAASGMVTVAIDAAKHGDRAYCTTGSTNQCLPGSACQAVPGFGTQGDATIPGRCTLTTGGPNGNGNPARRAVAGGTCPGGPFTCGIPVFSANYLISANFFRTRDTLRQDIVDQSQLVQALAFMPSGAPPYANGVFNHMAGRGLVIDPAKVYYSGQSLGAIQGTVDVAANPRISKAVLNVGGGTLVDVFTTSPAFSSGVGQLLGAMGITPGTAQYLQFLAVAKLILDPADPVNFAGHLATNTLPNLLADPTGATPQAPKKILTQAALCDDVVPNSWNYVLDANAGAGPLPGFPGFGPTGPGTFQLYMQPTGNPAAAIAACGSPTGTSPFAQPHAFLLDWNNPPLAARAQGDAAAFVVADTNPMSLVMLP